jgi:transposase
VCLNTVANWKHRWLKGRYFRLTDARRSGRPPIASKRYLKLMAEAVERGPHSYGYQFTVWSSARLAAHLEEKTGIALSPRQLRKWLSRQGFVFRRPKHTLKSRQNRRKVQAAKRHLAALKKGLLPILVDTTFGSKTRSTSICILT